MSLRTLARLCIEADKEGLEVLTSPSAITELLDSKKASAADKYDNSYVQDVGGLIEESKAADDTSMDMGDTATDGDASSEETPVDGEPAADGAAAPEEDTSNDADATVDEDSPVKAPDTVKDDGKPEEDAKSAPEPKEPVDDKKSAQENLRLNIVPQLWKPYFSVALEGNDISQYTDRKFTNTGYDSPGTALVEWTGDKLKDFYYWAKDIGVEYGPDVLDKAAKGLAAVTKGVAKGLISVTEVTRRFISRRNDSFKKVDKEISYLRNKLESYKDKDIKVQGAFDNSKYIRPLKRGKSVDVASNLSLMTKFTEGTIKGLATVIKQDYELMSHLMAIDSGSAVHDLSSILTMKHLESILAKGDMKGYEVKSDLLQGYTSKYSGMGDVKICAHVPKDNLGQGVEDPKEAFKLYRSAFEKSSMFIGVDMGNVAHAASIAFIGPAGLTRILDNLEEFVTKCKEHTAFYEETDHEINSFKTKFKVFLSSIVNAKKELTLEGTNCMLIKLRFGFIQKCYIPASMDIGDYCFVVIHAVIAYSEACLKSYR